MSTTPSSSRRALRPLALRKKTVFAFLFALALYATFEALCGLLRPFVMTPLERQAFDAPFSLSALQRFILGAVLSHTGGLLIHPLYGWTLNPSPPDQSDQHLRSLKHFEPAPAAGRVRAALFGDSFTYGQDVSFQETWASRLEAIDPRLEVLNFGVSGYGVDQAYLRFHEEAAAFHPDIVILSVIVDDLRRDMNRFRPFLVDNGLDIPLAKPRFRLMGRDLTLEAAPLTTEADYRALMDGALDISDRAADDPFNRRGHASRWYGHLPSYRLFRALRRRVAERDPADDEVRLGARIVRRFVVEAKGMGARPVVVLMPDLNTLQTNDMSSWEKGYRFIDAAKRSADVEVFDLRPFFSEKNGGRSLFGSDHFSASGNQLAAVEIHQRLLDAGFLSRRAADGTPVRR